VKSKYVFPSTSSICAPFALQAAIGEVLVAVAMNLWSFDMIFLALGPGGVTLILFCFFIKIPHRQASVYDGKLKYLCLPGKIHIYNN
jgi:hypothetical protein